MPPVIRPVRGSPPATPLDVLTALCLAAFFTVVQFYTSLDRLSSTPAVGYVIVPRTVALGMVAILVLGALLFATRCIRERELAPSWTILALWTCAVATTALLGFDPLSGLQMVCLLLLVSAFHVALVRYWSHPVVARTLVVSFLGAGIFAALSGVAMNVLHKPSALFALNHGRAAGFFVTPNQFAAYLLTMIAVAFGVAIAARREPLRILAWAAFGCGVLALLFTYSRGGWVSFGVGAAFFAFALGRRKVGWLLIALLVAGVSAEFFHLDAHHEPADALVRVSAWEAGARTFARFPLTGVGPMAYWHVYPALRAPDGEELGTFAALHPHSLFISLASEMGILGLAAVGCGWWAFVRLVKAELRDADPRRRALTLALIAGLVATFVHGLVDTIGIVELTFVWVPFTAMTLAVARYGLAPAEGRAAADARASRAMTEVA